jgi:hypothetical protein
MSSVNNTSHKNSKNSDFEGKKHKDPEIGWLIALLTYCSYALIISVGRRLLFNPRNYLDSNFSSIQIGHFRDFCANITGRTRYRKGPNKKGYANLFQSWESFYTRRLYHRLSDCWNRPICSSPMAYVNVMERESKGHDGVMVTTGKSLKCLNLGSYNYLGFAENTGPCAEQSIEAIRKYGISSCSSRTELGLSQYNEYCRHRVVINAFLS